MRVPDIPLAIIGPTAAGKSALAMAIAAVDDRVELISADSMQVYRGMDIGTAKPSLDRPKKPDASSSSKKAGRNAASGLKSPPA